VLATEAFFISVIHRVIPAHALMPALHLTDILSIAHAIPDQ